MIYQRDYQQKNKEVLAEKKRARIAAQREHIQKAKARPCEDCGIQYDYWIMDFDHVRGVKRFNLNRLAKMSASWRTITDEITKCEVVCSNCHRNRTFQRTLIG